MLRIIVLWVILLGIGDMLFAQNTYKKLTLTPIAKRADSFSEERLKKELMRHFPLLRRTQSTLALTHKIESPGAWHFTFQQYYQGLPIYQAGVKVTLSREGVAISCMDYLLEFTSAKQLDAGDFSARKQQFYARHTIEEVRKQVYYFPKGKTLIPGMLVIEEGKWVPEQKMIALASGKELHREPLALNYRPHFTSNDTSGRATVFSPNPCTRGNVVYGQLFIDNEDQDSPVLSALMDTVVLRDLTYEADSFQLKGPYVIIEDIRPRTVAPAASKDGNFFFTRSESGFEDVMVYYHIDRYQRYVQSLGFTNLHNWPVKADPHGFGDADQSGLILDPQAPYLLFGEGGVDDGEDADIIVHEYAHALSWAAAPGTTAGFERRGLEEGLADYFATRYSEDIDPFDWDKLFNWDGHNEFWEGRTAANPAMYPPNSSDFYRYGEVWASTLIQISEIIGKEVTDQLMLQEMYSNSNNMTLVDGAKLFLEADSLLFDQAHTEVINQVFCERGFLAGPNCLSVSVNPDPALDPEAWQVFPNPSEGILNIRLLYLRGTEPWKLRLINPLGQSVNFSLNQANESLNLAALSPGLYVLQVYEGQQFRGSKKWILR